MSPSSSIFGGARPVDTAAREQEVAQRLKQEEAGERLRKEVRVRGQEPISGGGVKSQSP